MEEIHVRLPGPCLNAVAFPVLPRHIQVEGSRKPDTVVHAPHGHHDLGILLGELLQRLVWGRVRSNEEHGVLVDLAGVGHVPFRPPILPCPLVPVDTTGISVNLEFPVGLLNELLLPAVLHEIVNLAGKIVGRVVAVQYD